MSPAGRRGGPGGREMLDGSRLVAFVGSVDLDRARGFYAGRLGLRLVEQTEFACVFAGADGPPTLRVTAAQAVVPAPYTVLGWVVADIEAALAGLAERGIEFIRFAGLDQDGLGIWSSPSRARVVWFRDPDGNLLSVTQLAS